jgi:hypothetical protein
MYPNPSANGVTTIKGMIGKNAITVYDMLGQMVHQEMTEQESTQLDLSNLAKGAYVIRIANDRNSTKTLKLQKSE